MPGCGSLYPEMICQEVRRTGAQLGVVLGTAMREPRDLRRRKRKRIINGDQIMGLIDMGYDEKTGTETKHRRGYRDEQCWV